MGNRGFYGFSSPEAAGRFNVLNYPFVTYLSAREISGKADGDAIGTWTDTINGNNATQGTGSQQPLYKVGVLNGQPCLRFDGSNDFMMCEFGSVLPGTDFGLLLVFAVRTNASIQIPFRDSLSTANTGTAIIGYATNSSSFWRINNTPGGTATNAGAEFGLTPHVVYMEKRGTVASVYRDGYLRDQFATGASLSIGASIYFARNSNQADYYQVDWGEFYIFSRALDSLERTTLTDNLKTVYGIP